MKPFGESLGLKIGKKLLESRPTEYSKPRNNNLFAKSDANLHTMTASKFIAQRFASPAKSHQTIKEDTLVESGFDIRGMVCLAISGEPKPAL